MTEATVAEIETSPLSGEIEGADQAMRVFIRRPAGTAHPWSLEVIDQQGLLIVWDRTFETDLEAYEAFQRAVIEGGFGSSNGEPNAC